MIKLSKIFAKKEPKWEDEYARLQTLKQEMLWLDSRAVSVDKRAKTGGASVYDYSVGFLSDCYLPQREWERHRVRWHRCLDDVENCLQNLAKNPKIYRHEYSWERFVEYVDWHGDERSRASQRLGNDAWYGTASFQDAMYLARNGWDELDKIIPNVQRFPLPNVQSVADMSWQYDVAGGSVDVGRY